MTPEILLKAYVQYQSEDAFRELVASTLDEVYSVAFRIVQGTPHLAEEIAVRVYVELARKAPRLGKNIVIASWLRERVCATAATVLRAEDRVVDRAAIKREQKVPSNPSPASPAPAGLANRICHNVSANTARSKGFGLYSLAGWMPIWVRPMHIGGVAVCVLAIAVWWHNPFHRHNPIVKSQTLQLTPASFAQRASPEDGAPSTNHLANTNAGINSKPK